LSLILVFKSPKFNLTLSPVVIVLKAERHNTTNGGTVIVDSTMTVEFPTILNVTSKPYNNLTVLYFFTLFN